MYYRKKAVVIEAITFDEFIEYGHKFIEENPQDGNYGSYENGNERSGLPWHFKYKGHPVRHESNTCYLIPTLEGTMNFTPDDMLITGVKGEIYPCKKDIFEATYQPENTINLSFGDAIQALKQGKRVARANWNGKGLFIFMQVPSVIGMEVVPRMQSLPQSVKDEFRKRFEIGSLDDLSAYPKGVDPIEMNTIKYKNQLAMVYPDNTIYGWIASPSDVLEEDWQILD